MLIIEHQEHFDKVREFARSVGAEAELQKQLDFLASFGGDAAKVRCYLYSDFAPHSFCWRMEHSALDGGKPGLVGGLIYSEQTPTVGRVARAQREARAATAT